MTAEHSHDHHHSDAGYEHRHEHEYDNAADHSEALSPSDGYFGASDSSHYASSSVPRRRDADSYPGVPSVPNVLVEDPSHPYPSAASHSKPLPHHHHNHHHNHHHSHTHYEDVPPAYEPSGPLSPQTGYQTIISSREVNSDDSESTMGGAGVPGERRSLLARPRAPESMSSGVPRVDERRRRWPSWLTWGAIRRRLATILGVLVIFSIVIVILQATLGSSKEEEPQPDGSWKAPSGDMTWSPLKECHDNPHRLPKVTGRVAFSSGRNLTIVQDQSTRLARHPHVGGELILKPAAGDDKSSGEIVVEAISNYYKLDDSSSATIVKHDEDTQAFTVTVPPTTGWDWDAWPLSPCIQIRITVLVPPRAVLDNLDIRLAHLNVDILPGVHLTTAALSSLSSTAGHIRMPADADAYGLDGRHIDISTTSGSVFGWFPLYDLLRIRSQSGSINIKIGPKPASDADPDATASLQLSTVSGSITAVAAALSFPSRDYVDVVSTVSGSIRAELPFSSLGRFESKNGFLSLALWPVLDPEAKARLTTSSINGYTDLVLKPPKWTTTAGAGVLGHLRSDHSSVSGSISLRYPAAWEGTVKADTVSGRQSFRGDGLHVYKEDKLVGSALEGYKGEGGSFLTVHSVSGSEDFVVG
jgi:hypothetical protein